MRERLLAADPESAVTLARATEQSLLAEVFEWYYQSETTEFFFQRFLKRNEDRNRPVSPLSKTNVPGGGRRVALAAGSAMLFFLRVSLGRLPWVVAAAAATLFLMIRAETVHPDFESRIRDVVWLVDENLKSWSPRPAEEVDGYVVLAHGMHDYVNRVVTVDSVPWMLESAQLVRERLRAEGVLHPEILLVDWKETAKPSDQASFRLFTPEMRLTHDIARIQDDANLVGRLVAGNLAIRYASGEMDVGKPLHMIGHSAGGFVISEIAIQLARLNWLPEDVYLTILDTPGFKEVRLQELEELLPDRVDIYMTTPAISFTSGSQAYNRLPLQGVRIHDVPSPESGIRESHSYAVRWFMQSVQDPNQSEGFGRSPLFQDTIRP